MLGWLGRELYGASRADLFATLDRAKHSRSGVDDLDFWRGEIEALGVGPYALSVVLDDGRMTEAARVWFILQHFGLSATVLNGGLGALSAVAPAGALTIRVTASRPRRREGRLAGSRQPEARSGGGAVFDARSAAEFRGEDLKGNARGGHLPGAAHVAHDALLDGTRLRPAAELARLLASGGIDGTRPIVSHCNGGGRAALAALAAVVVGLDDVHVYYLSFADWAADESCPVRMPY